MIDRNTRSEVEEENKEIASAIIKTKKVGSWMKIGNPFSWSYPPGIVNATANATVTISVATTIESFIHFKLPETRSLLFSKNN